MTDADGAAEWNSLMLFDARSEFLRAEAEVDEAAQGLAAWQDANPDSVAWSL